MVAMIDGPGSESKKSVESIPDIDTFRSDQPIAGPPPASSKPPQWTERQVGGNHYRKRKIQPATYIRANKLGFFEGNIVKLVSRYEDKGGLEDLDKLIHYAQMLREEYANELQESPNE